MKKVFVGLAAILPNLSFLVTMAYIVIQFIQLIKHKNPEHFVDTFFMTFLVQFLVVLISSFILIAVTLFFIFDLVSKNQNNFNKQVVWILILIFLGNFGPLLYYFIEYLPRKD